MIRRTLVRIAALILSPLLLWTPGDRRLLRHWLRTGGL